MNIVTVVPITRNTHADVLTYFSSLPISVGDLVSVPLRRKNIEGLVVHIQEAALEKAAIKTSKIGLRKVLRVHPHTLLSRAHIVAAQETAAYFAAPLGAVLSSVMPSLVRKYISLEAPPLSTSSIPETSILLADDEERLVQYRSLVREAFRRNESVMFVAASIQDVETAAHVLSKGIEAYTAVLHSEKSAHASKAAVERVRTETHPLLVITTPSFISMYPARLSTILLERENAPAYKQMARPFIDYRFFIKAFAKAARLRLVIGDTLLSSETVYKHEQGLYEELIVPKWRMGAKTKTQLVDMHRYKPDLRGKLRVISDELGSAIAETRAASDHLFIFAGRKGLAPSTICGDCGSMLICNRCTHPLVLHKTQDNKRFYLCHSCGDRKEADMRCKTCTSWRLFAFGIGTEIIEEALTTPSKGLTVFRLDGDSVKDRKHALQIVERFYSSPGSVLVGTELALPYLEKPLGAVAVASIDELFSIPDFRIHERVMYLLLKLRQLAERQFLIQTRTPDHEVIQSALEGNLSGFYRHELDIRRALLYPPFSVLIKITLSGNPQKINAEMKSLADKLPYELHVFPTFVRKGRGRSGLSGLLKIPRDKWPDENILSVLRSLPPSAEVQVEPESFA